MTVVGRVDGWDVLLADGGVVHVRPVLPGDGEALRALHRDVSDRGIYLRYFAVVRHAKAATASVVVSAGDTLRIEVCDDGVGPPAPGRRSGLTNLASRATELGGTLDITAASGGGTRLVWEVPLP
jgi:signal transduction histidine kinase